MAQQIPIPPAIEARRLLERVDYADAFVVAATTQATPERWARYALDESPAALRRFVRVAHRALGLRLAPAGSPDHPMGWDVLYRGPDAIVLGVGSGLVTPRVVVTCPPGQVVVTTLLRFEHALAPVAWAVVAPLHRRVARFLLDQGARAATTRPPVDR